MPISRIVATAAVTLAAFLSAGLVGQEGQLVSGTLTSEQGRVPERRLYFVPTNNFCPDTCSCETGRCEGDAPECKGKFCYHGFIARTNSNGAFGIMLPDANYEIHVTRIAPETTLEYTLTVKGEPVRDVSLFAPLYMLKAQERGRGR